MCEKKSSRSDRRFDFCCCRVMAAEKLRDLSQPIDVPGLDATVAAFYGTGSKEEVNFLELLFSEYLCVS